MLQYIIFILIGIILFILLKVYNSIFNGKNNHLSKTISNHNLLVCALTQKEYVGKDTTLTEEEIFRINSMKETDWCEWEHIITKMYKYYTANDQLVFDFIKEYFPNLFERSLFKKLTSSIYKYKMDTKEAAIRSLSLEEIQFMNSITETEWANRKKILYKINSIVNNNADGITIYKNIYKVKNNLPKLRILQEFATIEYLQKQYERSQNLIVWEKNQEDFYNQNRKFIREFYSNAGYYTYNIPYKRIQINGTSASSTYPILQSFSASFSPYHLDEQPKYKSTFYNKLPKFKTRTLHYTSDLYDNIFDVIKKIESLSEKKPLIVFINNSSYEWPKRTYTHHYNYLKSVLEDNDYTYINIDVLHNLTNKTDYQCVIIIDFITTNEDLFTNCNLILDFFDEQIPVIGYHSILKEYSEEEIIEIIEKEKNNEK